MKNLFFLIFFFVSTNSFSSDGVYFMDVDFLFKNSNYGKQIIKKLETINKNNISELDQKENKLKELEDEISKQKNIISKEELNKKIDNLKNKISNYRKEKAEKIKNFNEFKNKELNAFFKKVSPFIEDYMADNSIKIILDRKNIFIADSDHDITIKILEYLNNNL